MFGPVPYPASMSEHDKLRTIDWVQARQRIKKLAAQVEKLSWLVECMNEYDDEHLEYWEARWPAEQALRVT
jgi:hypothetical protein